MLQTIEVEEAPVMEACSGIGTVRFGNGQFVTEFSCEEVPLSVPGQSQPNVHAKPPSTRVLLPIQLHSK